MEFPKRIHLLVSVDGVEFAEPKKTVCYVDIPKNLRGMIPSSASESLVEVAKERGVRLLIGEAEVRLVGDAFAAQSMAEIIDDTLQLASRVFGAVDKMEEEKRCDIS